MDIVIVTSFNKPQKDVFLPQNNEVGGKQKSCDILAGIGPSIEPTFPKCLGKDMVDLEYELKKYYELTKPRLVNPALYNHDLDQLLNAVENWWIRTQRKSGGTFNRRRNLLEEMAKSPVFPIDLFDLDPDQVYYHLTWKEENYDKVSNRNGKDAMRNRWRALTMYAKAIGKDVSNWNYVPPKPGRPKHKIIPLPKDVYRMVHYHYSDDPYENALYQHLFFHGFLIGPRPDSEFSILECKNVHYEDKYVHFYQPKVGAWRLIALEPEVMTMATRKSYKNWIEKWRPKVENQKSGDYVYLQPNGKPFTDNYLRKQLNVMGKRVWPQFHPTVCRDWCSIARLIESDFNIEKVRKWMEHSDLRVT
ncbi:MAG: tyrosine-type recombinase/integrase [Candidatus Thermoplasmatota archaeon]|nr:tyrosine-type recombinase/integrase [Candidatus Thermoplasmatota archaeon]